MRPLLPTIALAAALIAAPALAQGAFYDVPANHWAAEAVRFAAVEHTFMRPYPDGSFRGDDPFTRAALAIALRRLLDDLEAQSRTTWQVADSGEYAFEDLPRDAAARTAALDVANRYRLFEGIPGVFATVLGAERRVTRYEMAIAIDHLLRLGEARGVIDPDVLPHRNQMPTDVPPGVPAAEAVREVATRYQVMVGFPDGTFRGPEELTRFQFAAAAHQTFPLVRDLVALTRERRLRRRFQEDMPLHLSMASRLDGPGGWYGAARWVGYAGPAFGLVRARLGVPVGSADRLSDVELAGGLAWTPGLALAFEPGVGGRVGVSGGTGLRAASVGLISSWNLDALQAWLDVETSKPLGVLGDPGGPFMSGVTLGFGRALASHAALTVELGYAQLPLAPTTPGYVFGTDGAFLGQVGLAFGF